MVFALSTESMVALAVMAAIFIGFSLFSSFYFPARDPDFPGKKWRNGYIVICGVLFVMMMGTVLIWGKEEPEAHAEGEASETTPGEQEGEQTETNAPTETNAQTGTNAATGNAAAGKVVFTTSACGSCHVLAAADATGAVGPNLDEAKPDAALVHERVVNGKGAMPAFEDQLTEQQIDDVVAFVSESAGSG